jgi:hypothetical protein
MISYYLFGVDEVRSVVMARLRSRTPYERSVALEGGSLGG